MYALTVPRRRTTCMRTHPRSHRCHALYCMQLAILLGSWTCRPDGRKRVAKAPAALKKRTLTDLRNAYQARSEVAEGPRGQNAA